MPILETRVARSRSSTSPLQGEFADVDEVTLCLKGVAWLDLPTHRNPDEPDAIVRFEGTGRGARSVTHDPALSSDFRKVITALFGYRFEEVALGDLLRSQGIVADEINASVPLATEVALARYGAPRAAK